jgi:DNA polymerase III gamma/tau subunit
MAIASPTPGFISIGQTVARETATRAVSRGRLQRTLLLHGPAGAGKGAFLDDLLALLLCRSDDPAGRPCNACQACRQARARVHPDLLIGSPAAWRESRATGESIVAAARRWLLGAATAPVAGELRVVVIEHSDQGNEAIQNALLKALEEPAARQMFVLVAEDPSRLLPTIRSRAQALRVGPVEHGQLQEWLVDRERLPADLAEDVARIAGGLAGRAIGYARNPPLLEWRRRTQAELVSLLRRGPADRFASVPDLLDAAASLGAAPPEAAEVVEDEPVKLAGAQQRAAALLVVEAWQALARDMLMVSAGRHDLAAASRQVPDLAAAARQLERSSITAFIDLLERISEGLRTNAAPRLAVERAMLAWPQLPAAAVPAAAVAATPPR